MTYFTGLLLPESPLVCFRRAETLPGYVLSDDQVQVLLSDPYRTPKASIFDDHWVAEGDQKHHNSCAGWGGANASSKAAYLAGQNPTGTVYSGSYPYSFANRGQDQGAALQDVMQALETNGFGVPASECDANSIYRNQCSKFDAEAKSLLGLSYYAAATQAEVNSALVKDHPVVVCVNVDTSVYVNYNGQGLVPAFAGKGNHCIHVDDLRWNASARQYEYRQVGNWGLNWGNKGTGWCTWKSFQQTIGYHMFYVCASVQVSSPSQPQP